jgi:hypothetical protein
MSSGEERAVSSGIASLDM